ncbi:hypothetical protein M4D54_02010 [Brachybacterium sp. p3-SID1565]|uniref:Uncharacterized protein n=1 Tax=Brachybacterium epidermidis TaxID=2781983 RepID=A0ABR9W1C9_9MICO|nr:MULTISPECIES: hypothetical protein [Brachybacterium]MBE9404261.1 hypothetical protein [Brachybacterium epidermidis]MCT1384415.1 hypothetical protein [Brachybacterium sp. p3-SID1565]
MYDIGGGEVIAYPQLVEKATGRGPQPPRAGSARGHARRGTDLADHRPDGGDADAQVQLDQDQSNAGQLQG